MIFLQLGKCSSYLIIRTKLSCKIGTAVHRALITDKKRTNGKAGNSITGS